ncbi:transglycosylase [Kribbella sp. ALI-6-A]|uniref:transglycosylase family protein n=1 Tax=Kribbella sp. ALI-6-A TaxID=1933817 RepID=UPI00097BAB4B|nr:transglycosylase family protein [Kribbella sp. ALI-6-A]ONI68350.1 transglycosylase [Kribbella sp. ALI-6-A]
MSKARHARPRRSTRRIARTLSVAGLGVGITAAGAGAAFATDYTVKPGDTLSEIAQANGTDWRQLAQLNDLANPDLILIGQTLELDGVSKAAVTERRSKAKPSAERSERKKADRSERKKPVKSERTNRSSRSESTRGSTSVSMSAAWRKVAQCESGGNPRAVNPTGKYHGLFQFDRQTWRSVGGTGTPSKASAAEQLMRAKKLYAQRGASPWPVCGRFLR